ncbi:MAG: hypothetical protein NZ556_08315 [Fimbriimonadales bacterium]|nr:hypothetical protein [Fimbriimonadales bacterium]
MMRVAALFGFLLWMASVAFAAEPLHFVPRNSYLIRPVASARDLANQIRTEPIVAQRYARHFRRSAWEFADYVEKNLRLTQLERAQTFNVYYSPPDDRILVVRRTLPKGTYVFVDKRTGKPILKANCGNPLTPAAPIPTPQVQTPIQSAPIMAMASPQLVESTSQAQPPLIELVEVPDTPIEEVVEADVLPTETLVETAPEVAPEPEPVAPPVMTAETPLPPAIVSRGPNLLPLLPLIVFFPPRGGDDFTPIPEPASALILGAGLGLLYPLSRRAFKRSQNSSQRTGDSSTHSA